MRPSFVSDYHDPCSNSRILEEGVKRGRKPRDPDNHVMGEGMAARRRRGWDAVVCSPNVHYSALTRWLASRAGRPWDDVWREICAVSDARNAPGLRLRRDASAAVARTARGADGIRMRILPRGRLGNRFRLSDGAEPEGFYVDPEGVLRNGAKAARTPPEPAAPCFVELPDGTELRLVDGAGYRFSFGPTPPEIRAAPIGGDGAVTDVLVSRGGGRDLRSGRWIYPSEHDFIAVSKRSLGRAELRRRGLSNDADAAAPARARR